MKRESISKDDTTLCSTTPASTGGIIAHLLRRGGTLLLGSAMLLGNAAPSFAAMQELPVKPPPSQQTTPPTPPQGPATRTIALPGVATPTLGTSSTAPATGDTATPSLPSRPIFTGPTLGSTKLRTFDQPSTASTAPIDTTVPSQMIPHEAVLLGLPRQDQNAPQTNPPTLPGVPASPQAMRPVYTPSATIINHDPERPRTPDYIQYSPASSRRLAFDNAQLPAAGQDAIADGPRDGSKPANLTDDLVNDLFNFIRQKGAAANQKTSTTATGEQQPQPWIDPPASPNKQVSQPTSRLTAEQLCLWSQALTMRSCVKCHWNPDMRRAGIMPLDMPWAVPGARGVRGAVLGSGELALGFLPVAGEAQDLIVLQDEDSKWWEKCLSGGSLVISGFTGTAAPNVGGFLRAGKRIDEVHDAVRGTDAATDATRAGGNAADSGRAADATADTSPSAPLTPEPHPAPDAPKTPEPSAPKSPEQGQTAAADAASGSKSAGTDPSAGNPTPGPDSPPSTPASSPAWNDYSDLHKAGAPVPRTTTKAARQNPDGSFSSVTPDELKKPKPDSHYSVNGFSYHTDGQGRVTRVEGTLDKIDPAPRKPDQQGAVGRSGVDRPEGYKQGDSDDGGHLIGSRFHGAGESINMVPQNSHLNQNGDWKIMENGWEKAIVDGNAVRVRIELKYSDSSVRPTSFDIVTQVGDGQVGTQTIVNTRTGK